MINLPVDGLRRRAILAVHKASDHFFVRGDCSPQLQCHAMLPHEM
jgi:hypothetical protein